MREPTSHYTDTKDLPYTLTLHNSTPHKSDRARKKITEILKKHGLQITIQTNMKDLDITVNVKTETFKPNDRDVKTK